MLDPEHGGGERPREVPSSPSPSSVLPRLVPVVHLLLLCACPGAPLLHPPPLLVPPPARLVLGEGEPSRPRARPHGQLGVAPVLGQPSHGASRQQPALVHHRHLLGRAADLQAAARGEGHPVLPGRSAHHGGGGMGRGRGGLLVVCVAEVPSAPHGGEG